MTNEFDKKTIEDFIKIIRDIVIDTVNNMGSNTERYYNGVVTSISEDGSTATVDIGDIKLENIPNKSGEILSVEGTDSHASFVRVYATTNTMTDAYIGRKLD